MTEDKGTEEGREDRGEEKCREDRGEEERREDRGEEEGGGEGEGGREAGRRRELERTQKGAVCGELWRWVVAQGNFCDLGVGGGRRREGEGREERTACR